jgi:F-type H+-transporting ATPase subunit b
MRIRKLVAVALLAAGMFVVLAQPAFAQDPGKKSGKELVECVDAAVKDNQATIKKGNYTPFTTALDDCRKAKSLFTPALNEILWGLAAFLVVAFILMKYGFPSIKQTIKNREDRIRDELESAAHAKEEAQSELERYNSQLTNARAEANKIVEDARQTAEGVRQDLIAKAEADAAEIRNRAQEDIRLAQDRALADLRSQVSDLSIELAEKVVEHNLDRDTQIALIENYINSVGNGQR